MRVRMPGMRVTVGALMVAVAGVGLLIGGSLELMRLGRLSREYDGRAINARRYLSYARMSADWTHERWVAACRDIDRTVAATSGWYKIGHPYPPDVARRHVAHWEPLALKYERASRYPWLPVEPDPPRPE